MLLQPASNILVPFMQPQFRRGRATAGGGGGTIGPISVAADADDGDIDNVAFHSNGANADGLGWAGHFGDYHWVFTRFVLPSAIPSGATITDATVVYRGRDMFNWVDGTSDLVIAATDSANASAPTTFGERPALSGGSTTLTTAQLAWNNVTWSTSADNTSDNLAAVIQELVDDNGGLSSSAGIVLWLRAGQAETRFVAMELLEHAGTTPARLTITYTE